MANFNYNSRTFKQIREDLVNYTKQYYPETYQDFTENQLGMLYIDLIAGASDILNTNIDRAYQETQLEYAQQRKSILQIAKTMGLNVPNKRGSVTIEDFTVIVPPKGDKFDVDYLPVLKAGTQVTGGGRVFELLEDIDFNSTVSSFGSPNRLVYPVLDKNELVVNYRIVKREVVYNGISKIFNKTIRNADFKPFLKILLPDTDVIEIDSIILLPGINNPSVPDINLFYDDQYKFFEVDWLLQDRLFINDTSYTPEGFLKAGKWIKVTKKFIKEFTDKGFCRLTFGGGNGDLSLFESVMNSGGVYNGLDGFLQNTSLGEIPSVNSQLYVKYRTGGGSQSNVGANILTSTGLVNMYVNGPDDKMNQNVRRSLTVNNPVPALGGSDAPSTEQIRWMTAYNFASQNRCVTLNDYLVQIYKMPGKFGGVFKTNVHKEDNKVVVSVIGLNEDGKLDNTNTSLLMNNIAEYLSQYREINDYVEVRPGKIYNLGFDFELYIDENIPSNQIALNVINTVKEYFNINNAEMNEDIYLGQLIEAVNNVKGVINIISYKCYNKVGTPYSINEIEQQYKDNSTREILLVNNTLYSSLDSMFEIKYPEKDIKLYLKKKTDLVR